MATAKDLNDFGAGKIVDRQKERLRNLEDEFNVIFSLMPRIYGLYFEWQKQCTKQLWLVNPEDTFGVRRIEEGNGLSSKSMVVNSFYDFECPTVRQDKNASAFRQLVKIIK